jgi:hypothetical protein
MDVPLFRIWMGEEEEEDDKQYMMFYISSSGPNCTTMATAVNIWCEFLLF